MIEKSASQGRQLGRGRGEGAANSAVQRAFAEPAAGLIEEVRHRPDHPAKRGPLPTMIAWFGEVLDLGDRRGLVT